MELYKKYRPNNLNDFVSGTNLSSLSNFIDNPDHCPHTFLFTGQTGCGKTTLARIVAKGIGAKGSDIEEINSADFSGIDTIRDIRHKSKYSPVESDKKVYIIDELHELSRPAMDAMLKLLEETPDYLYFILVTTNPEKLLPALKNRCSVYNLPVLEERQLTILLKSIAKQEGKELNREVSKQIYKSSDGIPRAAIQILQQVLEVEDDNQLDVAKQSNKKEIDAIELCRALLKQEGWGKVSGILGKLKDEEPESIRRLVLAYCTSILLKEKNMLAGRIMEVFIEPFHYSGFNGLVFACYEIVMGD